MFKINWANNLENFLCLIIGGLIVYFSMNITQKNTLKEVTPTINEAINKKTVENNINTSLEVGKIKKSDSIMIVLDSKNDQKPITNIVDENKNPNIVDISNLSERRKRNIKKWIKNASN